MNQRPLLIMLLGVPGSGKTYFSQQLAQRLHGVRLNSDAMRLSIFGSLEVMDKLYGSPDRWQLNAYTFGAMDYVTGQLLAAGTSVIYDAIHAKRADRQKQEAAAKNSVRCQYLYGSPRRAILQFAVSSNARRPMTHASLRRKKQKRQFATLKIQ